MKLVLASNNAHKLVEMRTILNELGMEVMTQKEAGVDIEPEENGATFEENSYIKARAVMEASGLPAIADDSGLMGDPLGGEPGVYSARYGGEINKNDWDRLVYLLKKMEQIPDGQRSAKFVSVITMVTPDGKVIAARGECPGTILWEARGTGGFGYDPIFYATEAGCTFAEVTAEVKNQMSHRARALAAFAAKVREENEHVNNETAR